MPVSAGLTSKTFKLALIGDTNTGKTSIFQRWRDDSFCESAQATIGSDYCVKTFFEGHYNVRVMIYDTAGQEIYKSLTTNVIRDADFIAFVFSYDDIQSFENLKFWLSTARKANDSFVPILIGNKYDLLALVQQD